LKGYHRSKTLKGIYPLLSPLKLFLIITPLSMTNTPTLLTATVGQCVCDGHAMFAPLLNELRVSISSHHRAPCSWLLCLAHCSWLNCLGLGGVSCAKCERRCRYGLQVLFRLHATTTNNCERRQMLLFIFGCDAVFLPLLDSALPSLSFAVIINHYTLWLQLLSSILFSYFWHGLSCGN